MYSLAVINLHFITSYLATCLSFFFNQFKKEVHGDGDKLSGQKTIIVLRFLFVRQLKTGHVFAGRDFWYPQGKEKYFSQYTRY